MFSWHGKKILVTGASGFIGLNLIERLKKQKVKLFPVVNTQKEKLDVPFEVIDLLDFNLLSSYVRKIRPVIIFHLGALVDLARDFRIAAKCIDINIKGTIHLLEALKGLSFERLILSSTEEVYGDGPIPYTEDQQLRPPSAYAISKTAAEHLCKMYAALYNYPVTILRVATIYGPKQPLERFIPGIIVKAIYNKDIPLNSGRKKRDYIYVGDVVEAMLEAVKKEKAIGEVINIGGQAPISLKEIVNIILRLTESSSKPLFNSFPDRANEADIWLSDNQKAFRLLHWKPITNIEGGLKKTIAYYQQLSLITRQAQKLS